MFPPGHPYYWVMSCKDVTQATNAAIPLALTSGKSAAALPLAVQVTPMVTATSSTHSGYCPKGRPQGEEPEDDSDSPDA